MGRIAKREVLPADGTERDAAGEGGDMSEESRDYRVQITSVREEVYRILREQILNFVYPPGHRFDLHEIEAALGVSRTPLKETLQRLEAEGLVEIRPRRGTFVTEIDEREIRESFQMRAILEYGAVDILVESITDAEIVELENLHNSMSALLENHDYQSIVARYIQMDKEFHRRLIGFTRHRLLIAHHAQVDTILHVARLRRRFDRASSLQTKEEHAAILDALKGRNRAALREAINAHIEGAVHRMMGVLPDRRSGDDVETRRERHASTVDESSTE